MNRFARVLMMGSTVVAMAAPLAALPVSAQAQTVSGGSMSQPLPSLNLSAVGRVQVSPDQATITFGVVTEAANAQEAMQANARQMTQVIAALRRAGISEREVQTSGLSLSAQYDYQQNESPKLRGYQASNRVTVIINDLTKVGRTADAVVGAGVNQIEGISFGLKDPSAAEDQARRLAVRALQSKAALYSEALGVPLGGIRSLSEGGGYVPQSPPMVMARMASSDASTPIEAGELTIQVEVSGVYDLMR